MGEPNVSLPLANIYFLTGNRRKGEEVLDQFVSTARRIATPDDLDKLFAFSKQWCVDHKADAGVLGDLRSVAK